MVLVNVVCFWDGIRVRCVVVTRGRMPALCVRQHIQRGGRGPGRVRVWFRVRVRVRDTVTISVRRENSMCPIRESNSVTASVTSRRYS